jgi:hypothetical protein
METTASILAALAIRGGGEKTMIADHDDEALERRPVQHAAVDVKVAREEKRVAKRILDTATLCFGTPWARGVTVSFREGQPVLAHVDGESDALTELRAELRRQLAEGRA